MHRHRTMTSAPSAILYQPNNSKSCFLTKSIKNLITNSETTNATTMPNISAEICGVVITPPFLTNLSILYPLAPTIVGIARKNVNSAAAVLERPKISAPIIVTPDLDVPGTAART